MQITNPSFWAKRRASTKSQAGLSLAEAGLVLALGMIASVLAFAAYSTGVKSINVKAETEDMIELISNIERLYVHVTPDQEVELRDAVIPTRYRNGSEGPIFTSSGWGVGIVSGGSGFMVGVIGVSGSNSSCVDFISAVAAAGYNVAVGLPGALTSLSNGGGEALDVTLVTQECSTMPPMDPNGNPSKAIFISPYRLDALSGTS